MAAVKPVKLVDLGSGQGALKEFETADQLGMALNEAATVTIASAGTTDVGAALANSALVSGTTTITALGTAPAGAKRAIRFSGVLTLTHNGTSLILPGAANITTAANDSAEFLSLGSGNWFCVLYTRANGRAVVATDPAWGAITGTLSAQTDLQSALNAKLSGNTKQLASAWVNFNGSSLAIRDSFNVSSITRNAVGDYTVNLTAALANANYAFFVNGQSFGSLTNTPTTVIGANATPTTSALRVFTQAGPAGVDLTAVTVVIFGG